MNELIENLRAAYQERITGSTWMDDATRKAALAKLAAFEPRIGHPVKYIDYASLKVDRGDALGNAMRSPSSSISCSSRFPKPVDRSLWNMTPQTVNAYYNPLANQITFPAAILQPPYFDPNADPAVNYGAIGAIIGHEMGHGFDDQGSMFGPTGKFENWWTDAAKKGFKERTAALSAQYNGYEPIPGTKINGADARREYRRSRRRRGGLCGVSEISGQARQGEGDRRADRRSALLPVLCAGVAGQGARGAQRQQLLTDPHSPAMFRVNGIVRNVDAWYKAFDVKPGDALYLAPEQRVHIW
jgi:putative endopeptidase